MNPFSREPDAEIADRWLHIVEDTLDQMQVADY